MATKAYVVSNGAFQYDDNYYSSTDGGYPQKVFLEKEQAEEYAEGVAFKRFKELVEHNEIFYYGYGDLDGVFNTSDEFEEFIQKHFKTTPEDWWDKRDYNRNEDEDEDEDDDEIMSTMSEEEWKKFYKFCHLDLVYINEVGFGDVFS